MKEKKYVEKTYPVTGMHCAACAANVEKMLLRVDGVRSAAVNLAAAVLRTDAGKNPRSPVIINADGTTFYKTEFLHYYTSLYLKTFLEHRHGRFAKMIRLDDSPALGAAIAGLSV